MKPFERFLNPHVDVRMHLGVPHRERPYETLNELVYQSAFLDDPIVVVAGYRTDFATIPRLFWRVLPPAGSYSGAAVVHDWLCDYRPVNSDLAHRIFREAMVDLRVPAWKVWLMYRAVAWFGPRFVAEVRADDDTVLDEEGWV